MVGGICRSRDDHVMDDLLSTSRRYDIPVYIGGAAGTRELLTELHRLTSSGEVTGEARRTLSRDGGADQS